MIPTLTDSDILAVKTEEGYIKLACCDCGLTHKIYFKIPVNMPDLVLLNFKRDDKATGQIRRRKGCSLLSRDNLKYKMVKNG